jgi:hypothetical protein
MHYCSATQGAKQPTHSLGFALGWKYGCGSAGCLVAIPVTGTFSDLRLASRPVIIPAYSAVLLSPLDDHYSIPGHAQASGPNPTSSEMMNGQSN